MSWSEQRLGRGLAGGLRRRDWLLGTAAMACAQDPAPDPDVDFVCPMDREVHAKNPGKCPRCGMRLVAGLPNPVEFRVDLSTLPKRVQPQKPITLRLRPVDPRPQAAPPKLQLIHERLFHLFLIGPDLSFFAHEHPELQPDGSFLLSTQLPSAGVYRLLCDFYPEQATPQMVVKSLIVPGAPVPAAARVVDVTPKRFGATTLRLETEPSELLSAQASRLMFQVDPVGGFEPFLGAWGHLLIASADRQDLIHTHPFLAYPERGALQFNVIFPRPGLHRIWLQVQRAGEVLTAVFDVPVRRLS